jgi:hypothetical protein
VADPPKLTELPLIVTALFVSEALPMLLSVLLAPLIVLFVNVCEPVSVATVLSIEIVPVEVIGPPVNPVPVATDVTPEPAAKSCRSRLPCS